jgi:hypothetical protein
MNAQGKRHNEAVSVLSALLGPVLEICRETSGIRLAILLFINVFYYIEESNSHKENRNIY